MESWGQFIWTVIASSAGTTVLLSAAAWLFKGQIGHWLSKDLEAVKARHQRDLEAYKTSLIVEAERAKSGQELKRAAALKMLEMKVDAFKKLYDARRNLGTLFLGHSEMSAAWKTSQRYNEAQKRLDEFTEAMGGVELFLENKDYRILIDYRGQLVETLERCNVGVEPLPKEEQKAASRKVLEHEIASDLMIQAQFQKLESLD